ncbi:MAG: hypothetical protein LBM13_00625 [Candidatus Ancillula sp.]|nr:hypothetical protein [Candidatus Ancillula sp.]
MSNAEYLGSSVSSASGPGENLLGDFPDFEFERRFFCQEMPRLDDDGFPPHLIIQSYFLAEDGYAIRVRLQASEVKIKMTERLKSKEAIEEVLDNFSKMWDMAFITVKGPTIGGTRYEVENSIDVLVAAEMIRRSKAEQIIVKNRHSYWAGKDGWVIDEFAGKNYGLVIAECERLSPVTDLEIPEFCTKEVTDDTRFSNDKLVKNPYMKWAKDYKIELNQILKDSPEKIFSNQFGQNAFRR